MAGVTGTQYTGQSVLGCTWNQELAGRMGTTFAQEAIAYNISGLYAPGLNIFRSPFSGATMSIFPRTASTPARWRRRDTGHPVPGRVLLLQALAVNDQETNRDQGGLCTWLNEQAMREVYLKGFELAVKEGHSRA